VLAQLPPLKPLSAEALAGQWQAQQLGPNLSSALDNQP
jgi:hypothetical protein